MDIPEYKPDSTQIAYYKAIMNRVPEKQRIRYKEIYAERGKLLRDLRPTGKELLKYKYQWYIQDFLACVASVDENVGRILDYLDQKKLTNSTAVLYTSDQGFFLGENGWFDKRFAYDVSMQTPLLMRWPGQIQPGSITNSMVQKKTLNRNYLYYHYYEFVRDHTVIPHLAVRGTRYKLIYFYTVNEWELYDLKTDPQEQKNLIKNPAYQKTVQQMKAELLKLRDQYDDHEKAGELN